MTSRKPNPDAAEAAARTYVDAVTQRVLSAGLDARLHLRDLNASFVEAWAHAGYPAEAAEGILDAGRAGLIQFAGLVRRTKTGQAVLSQSTARRTLAPLMNAESMIDAALAAFDRRDELVAASEQLDRARAAFDEGRADLEAAVNAGDVERVMALRSEVEITRQAAVAEAELAVADLKILQAQAIARRRHDKADGLKQATAEAEDTRSAARAALAEAEARAQRLRDESARAAAAVSDAESRVTAMIESRDERKQRADDDRVTRLRRLAGLPVETAGARS